MPLKRLTALVILCGFLPSQSFASNWRWGGGIGFGGTGIEKQVETAELGLTKAQKSESPGMLHLFVETVVDRRYVVSIEHSRGFRLGPFSSGLGFTSLCLRYHYLGSAPTVDGYTSDTDLFIKKWSPYTGGYFGLAFGTLTREGDQIPSVTGSGIHFGLKNGVDYSYNRSLILRWEIAAASTFFQAPTRPATLNEFSLWMGLIFPF